MRNSDLFELAKDMARLQVIKVKPLTVDRSEINKTIYRQKEIPIGVRKAKCCYCNNKHESNPSLAFFRELPEKPFDEYYCGCFGWD